LFHGYSLGALIENLDRDRCRGDRARWTHC